MAVIDTGVDVKNPQLTQAVDVKARQDFLPKNLKTRRREIERGNEHGTTDTVGHGTKVAGIIAARPPKGTGFVGLAPDADDHPDPAERRGGQRNGRHPGPGHPLRRRREGADVINISQDTADAVDADTAPGAGGRPRPRPRTSWSSPRRATTAWTARSR